MRQELCTEDSIVDFSDINADKLMLQSMGHSTELPNPIRNCNSVNDALMSGTASHTAGVDDDCSESIGLRATWLVARSWPEDSSE